MHKDSIHQCQLMEKKVDIAFWLISFFLIHWTGSFGKFFIPARPLQSLISLKKRDTLNYNGHTEIKPLYRSGMDL